MPVDLLTMIKKAESVNMILEYTDKRKGLVDKVFCYYGCLSRTLQTSFPEKKYLM
jgi:hypothetical protein